MLENFALINELDAKRVEYASAVSRFCEPLLHCVDFIEDIYKASQFGYADPVEERRAFIFAVLFFYSPKKLLSMERCRPDVMAKMCALTKCSQSLISYDSRNLLFHYQHYVELRMLVDETIERAKKLLLLRGINAQPYIIRFGNEEKENGQEETCREA